jgi:excisionase family DNA binding protein
MQTADMETGVRWPELMDYDTVRAYCGLSRTSTWRLIKAGELEAFKIGRSVKVRRASLDAYFDRHEYTTS